MLFHVEDSIIFSHLCCQLCGSSNKSFEPFLFLKITPKDEGWQSYKTISRLGCSFGTILRQSKRIWDSCPLVMCSNVRCGLTGPNSRVKQKPSCDWNCLWCLLQWQPWSFILTISPGDDGRLSSQDEHEKCYEEPPDSERQHLFQFPIRWLVIWIHEVSFLINDLNSWQGKCDLLWPFHESTPRLPEMIRSKLKQREKTACSHPVIYILNTIIKERFFCNIPSHFFFSWVIILHHQKNNILYL